MQKFFARLSNQMFARKSLETLLAEMKGENRLRRILGPINMTALGIGAIIGAGIFVMTGRAAAVEAGPAIMLSYVVAGLGCVFAALCYAEFASAVPVAGSAYTYAYATLGEIIGWIIGWDLIFEYAMSCAPVASAWSEYLNEFLIAAFNSPIRQNLTAEPFTTPGAIMNLPALLIMVAVTVILVIGIRESATTNAILVGIKVGVVLFVIAIGIFFVTPKNWNDVPVTRRLTPQEKEIPKIVGKYVQETEHLDGEKAEDRTKQLKGYTLAQYKIDHIKNLTSQLQSDGKMSADEAAKEVADVEEQYSPELAQDETDKGKAKKLADEAEATEVNPAEKWGMLSTIGLNRWLLPIDESSRTRFMPYGISGIMLGAAIVFFAYIGFDSISAHSEEAKVPQRDVPIGILASLAICTVFYIAVSAIITGMEPYPQIDQKAAVAVAFRHRAEAQENNPLLRAAGVLIAAGGLAGMTSVLLITFLSQARIFLAMARDGLLPKGIF